MIDTSGLEAAVTAETTDLDSFVTLFNNLKAQLATELANDPAAQAKVNAVLDAIIANRAKIVAAMQANVP